MPEGIDLHHVKVHAVLDYEVHILILDTGRALISFKCESSKPQCFISIYHIYHWKQLSRTVEGVEGIQCSRTGYIKRAESIGQI